LPNKPIYLLKNYKAGKMRRIIGIGNALVDIMVRLEDERMLSVFSLPKGSMQLVDENRSEQVKSGTSHLERSVSPGGSIANTIHTLGVLGARPGYIGSVGSDIMLPPIRRGLLRFTSGRQWS
jgi:sugar/nucleoside kinase (ribokinase family)